MLKAVHRSLAIVIIACQAMLGSIALAYDQIPHGSIKRVSILIVDGGKTFDTQFGHVSLRLSEKKTLSPKDMVLNLTLTQPANDSSIVAAFRSIGIGKPYDTVVYIQTYGHFREPFHQAGRGITSDVIKLDEEAINQVVGQVNKILKRANWKRAGWRDEASQGKMYRLGHGYNVVLNNCASMSTRIVNKGARKNFFGLSAFRPLRLHDKLYDLGLIEETVYDPAP